MKDDLGLDMSLSQLGAHHMEVNLSMDGFSQSKEGILTILDLEEARYHEMLRKGEAAVQTALAKVPKDVVNAPDEILFKLAEERGLQPDMVASIANRLGWNNLGIRVGFTADMAARNAQQTKAAAKAKGKQKLVSGDWPATERRYYDHTSLVQFEASVLHCTEIDASKLNISSEVQGIPTHAIILDHTLFYPEGGGQLGDSGTLGAATVFDTHIEGDVILHLTDGPLSGTVNGEVSWKRRKQLMDHHTSVHIIGGSARALLGPHIWQAGSSKGERYARLDITHFQRLTRDNLDAIEDHANAIIAANPTVEKMVMERADADAEFGFELYQGGPPKHQQIRVIRIGEHDVQACGGTHHDQAGEIGEIRIIRSSQVQDGVERLQIVAGETAREHARRQERLLTESAETLGVAIDDLPKTVNRFFEEWKSQQKKIESLEAEIVRLRTSGGGDEAIEKDGIRYVVMESTGELKQMQNMVGELTRDPSKPTVAVVGSREGGGKLIVAITEGTSAAESHNAVEILNAIAGHIGGGGGGRPTFAQGGGSNADGLDAALDAAKSTLGL